MSNDPAAIALQRLHVAQANYRMACQARISTRELLDEAVRQGSEAGLSKAEIGRAIGTTGQRISQILSEE
jgi:hypothetical protein